MDSSRNDNTYHEEETYPAEEERYPAEEEINPQEEEAHPQEEETYSPPEEETHPQEEETYPVEEEIPSFVPGFNPTHTPTPTPVPEETPSPSTRPPFVPGFNPPTLPPKKKSHVIDPKIQDLYCAPITNAFACDLSGSCSWVNSQNRCYSLTTADLFNSIGGSQSSGSDDSFGPAQLPAININSPLNFVFDDAITVESTAECDNDGDTGDCYYDEEQDRMVCPPTTNVMVLDPIVSSILKEKIVVEEKPTSQEESNHFKKNEFNCQRPCFHDGASCDMNRYIASGAPSKDNRWWAADKQAENQNRVCGNTFDGHLYANLTDHNLYSSVLSPVSGDTIPFAEVNPSQVSSPNDQHPSSKPTYPQNHSRQSEQQQQQGQHQHQQHQQQQQQHHSSSNNPSGKKSSGIEGSPVEDHSNIPYCSKSKNQEYGISLPNPLKSELYCESASQIHTNTGPEHCRNSEKNQDCCPPNSHHCRPRYDGDREPLIEGFGMTDHTIDFSTKWLVGCIVIFTIYFTIKIFLKKR